MVIVNAGHPEGSDDLEKVLAAGLRESYAHVMRDPITEFNTLLIASDERADRGAAAARDAGRRPAPAAGARGDRAAARARRRAAATSSRTTARRSSG